LDDGEEPSLTLSPSDASFTETKPDRTRECTVKVALSSGKGEAWFKVFLRQENGELVPISSIGVDHREGTNPEDDIVLGKWLSANPAEGRIKPAETKEVKISLTLYRAVLRSHTSEACLVFSVSSKPIGRVSMCEGNSSFIVRASLEPSVMRLPLSTLAALGSRPIISDPNSPLDNAAPLPCGEAVGGHAPKEVMAVMQWVLRQSRDEAPGSLNWWPDPLANDARRGQDELLELQRRVEQNMPLPTYVRSSPRTSPQMPARSAAVFLMRWLTVLPEPVIPASVLDQFEKDSDFNAVLKSIPTLPKNVIVCITSLFAQLTQRHGGAGGDLSQRLAACFTQQAKPSAMAEQLLTALLNEFRSDDTWPPNRYLAASL
jgi:hypothetical protein